ncbi:MAG: ABC transporter permease [Verrucomicrobia bacterium]|nr:ABC transporter permease [Verrucomicrobiota bacterium]
MNFFQTIFTKRYLILKYLRRQISRRYRGSILGVLWSLASPLAMLSVYLFVFGFIFKSRFNITKNESAADFGLALFCGLNLYNLCSEVITSSPKLILGQPNLVKKIVFPLETLPVVQTLDSLFHCAIAFVPLLVGLILLYGTIPWTFIFLPLFLVPLALFSVGFSLGLSALGVFIRDIEELVQPLLIILMYGSAVFYPIGAMPPPFRQIIELNPLALVIENARLSMMLGAAPNLGLMLTLSFVGFIFVMVTSAFFEKAKPAFADVI